jgi:hypothetical protein
LFQWHCRRETAQSTAEIEFNWTVSRDETLMVNALPIPASRSALLARKANEAQGKKMKTYKSERHILKMGTKELEAAFERRRMNARIVCRPRNHDGQNKY